MALNRTKARTFIISVIPRIGARWHPEYSMGVRIIDKYSLRTVRRSKFIAFSVETVELASLGSADRTERREAIDLVLVRRMTATVHTVHRVVYHLFHQGKSLSSSSGVRRPVSMSWSRLKLSGMSAGCQNQRLIFRALAFEPAGPRFSPVNANQSLFASETSNVSHLPVSSCTIMDILYLCS